LIPALATMCLVAIAAAQTYDQNQTPAAQTAPDQSVSGGLHVMVDRTQVTFSGAQPQMIAGQMMIPVRDIADQMGGTVTWDDLSKEVQINVPNQVPLVALGMSQADWNATTDQGRAQRFAIDGNLNTDLPPQAVVIDGHAYMPIQEMAMDMGGTVTWDPSSTTATLTLNQNNNGSASSSGQ
jgi:hypothetical protein